jgi:hypothetical protein
MLRRETLAKSIAEKNRKHAEVYEASNSDSLDGYSGFEVFYLDSDLEIYFSIFEQAMLFTESDGRFSPAIILALIKEKKLPIAGTLVNLNLLLQGYHSETTVET